MPIKVKGDDGQERELYEPAEVESARAEAAKKKEDELQGDISPNWRETRKKLKEQEDMIEALKKGEKPKSEPITAEDVGKISEAKANEMYLDRYADRVLTQYGDKGETVKAYFNKLKAGEKLDEGRIDQLMQDAARAVGVVTKPTRPAHQGLHGAAPQFVEEGKDEGFGASEAGKATAAAMNLPIEVPKK